MRGRRRTPGRPVTYGTTEAFLDHFGLESLADLPGLEELKGSGLLSNRLPPNMQIPLPFDGPLREDEDPLDPEDLAEDEPAEPAELAESAEPAEPAEAEEREG
jgi:segregation and condensation protein B